MMRVSSKQNMETNKKRCPKYSNEMTSPVRTVKQNGREDTKKKQMVFLSDSLLKNFQHTTDSQNPMFRDRCGVKLNKIFTNRGELDDTYVVKLSSKDRSAAKESLRQLTEDMIRIAYHNRGSKQDDVDVDGRKLSDIQNMSDSGVGDMTDSGIGNMSDSGIGNKSDSGDRKISDTIVRNMSDSGVRNMCDSGLCLNEDINQFEFASDKEGWLFSFSFISIFFAQVGVKEGREGCGWRKHTDIIRLNFMTD